MKWNLFKFITVLLLSISCSKKERLLVGLHQDQTGVQFSNTLTDTPELNILNYLYYYNGAGVVAADFNNDDLIDLFFTGNQVADELYLNKGEFKFQEITKLAGIPPETSWSTGATHVDINNDGLLDIYICKASGYRNLKGKNLLYVNQGVNSQGIPTFKEEASKYGLNFLGMSTHAAFFDYDLDGDLDMYLLNHSVHPNRNYGYGSLREGYHPKFGDILFENNNDYFEEVSEEAGIFQGQIGYGLGLSIGDINNDGYPDMYIGNDFFENDYLYINQKDKTFKEIISQDPNKLGHTTHFSMGNTIADLNNDGMLDILSLDMLPEDLKTYKSSGLEYGYPIYRQYLTKGYAPQYMQNTLHLNLDGERFSDVAQLSNVAATEWSWGTLAADFDNDGHKDLFVSNGIVGATNDMDYMNFIANEDIQKRIDKGMVKDDLPLVEEIPQKKVSNYLFKNNGDLTFANVTSEWMNAKPSFSNGSVVVDLDNDGDLDLVTNNINEPASIFKNNSNETNFLSVKFEGPKNNVFGIGTRVVLFTSEIQTQENYPTKGYLSAVAPQLHFGLGKDTIVDSLVVQWTDGSIQKLSSIKSNQTLTIRHKEAKKRTSEKTDGPKFKRNFSSNDSLIPFVHKENISLDFDREPLIPFANSNEGPTISTADINDDGLQDVFIGGAKKQPSQLLLQQPTGEFISVQTELFEPFSLKEATCSAFFDINGDGWQDLIVAYGGNEFSEGVTIRPQLFINNEGTFEVAQAFDNSIEGNFSAMAVEDFDGDEDLDLILTADQIPGEFGKTPKSFILFNNGNNRFDDLTTQFAPDFEFLGNLKDVKTVDINSDGKMDVIAVGHWTPISVFINTGEKLQLQKNNGLQNTEGWWNSIEIGDFDNDGDLDIICGNWGLNSKFGASLDKPIHLYRNDFDENGTTEPLVTYFHKNTETPFASKDELVKQLPFLNKEYLSYSKFASASLRDLFGEDKLQASQQKKIVELETSHFENMGNATFEKKKLPLLVQSSQIRKIISDDVNNDGALDLIFMGNNHHISTQLGRLDALHGLVLFNDGQGDFNGPLEHLQVDGQVNTIEKIMIHRDTAFIIGRNDDSPVLLKKNTL